MSELKAGVITTPHNEGMSFDRGSDAITVTEGETEFYLKSEADKVIAHQKRKRCLAMARWCNERIVRIEKDYAFWRYGKDYAINFYKKWHKRWLAIAEKFKEAK